ncbi:MAG TPA: S1 RNA-binding domain-containing protein [Candidatus Scatomonas merdigallinarum]|nr:S1 RNA-binding domain-containing protein [Candidatus Scatomonas merdigallinarum]
MLELGKKQRLKVVKKVDFGVYLAEEDGDKKEDRVLLPAKQVPEGAGPGTELEVFLYKDSSDRLIATTREPRLTLGETALLTVAEVGRIGAFLDWGLEKDLLLPYREQTGPVKKGDQVLAALYIDKSQRLCATMKVYHYLKQHSPYVIGDQVKGRVYEISRNFGVFVAVDDQYSALIPRREAQGRYQVGQELSLRVTEVKEDGKLTVSARQKAYLQIGQDAELVLEAIEKAGGRLDFDDKASPEKIDEELGLSKAAFKRAVGHLLKEGKIQLEPGKILLK